MSRTIFLFCFVALSFISQAHEFFFSFAEIEIDELNGRIEVSLQVTTHDFEKQLAVDGVTKKLAGNEQDSVFVQWLEKEIARGFNLTFQGGSINLELEAYEVQLNGLTYFYLSAHFPEKLKEFNVVYDLLMGLFSDQQNKITLLCRDKKSTYVFLPTRRTQTIILS